jgi:cell wall-associated NlpC family hydrolase
MVQSATAMLGQPYRFGGAAPGGFDCSGLVIFAARSAGIHLPRTVKDQLRAGVPIALGAGRFIHAPASGGRVRIDSLAAPPYSTGFMSARRVIGFERRTADPWVDLAILA